MRTLLLTPHPPLLSPRRLPRQRRGTTDSEAIPVTCTAPEPHPLSLPTGFRPRPGPLPRPVDCLTRRHPRAHTSPESIRARPVDWSLIPPNFVRALNRTPHTLSGNRSPLVRVVKHLHSPLPTSVVPLDSVSLTSPRQRRVQLAEPANDSTGHSLSHTRTGHPTISAAPLAARTQLYHSNESTAAHSPAAPVERVVAVSLTKAKHVCQLLWPQLPPRLAAHELHRFVALARPPLSLP